MTDQEVEDLKQAVQARYRVITNGTMYRVQRYSDGLKLFGYQIFKPRWKFYHVLDENTGRRLYLAESCVKGLAIEYLERAVRHEMHCELYKRGRKEYDPNRWIPI